MTSITYAVGYKEGNQYLRGDFQGTQVCRLPPCRRRKGSGNRPAGPQAEGGSRTALCQKKFQWRNRLERSAAL